MDIVEQLVAALNEVDGVTASTKESDLNLPAVWVRPISLQVLTLKSGWTPVVQLRLMVPSIDAERDRKALMDLFAKVATVADPDDDPKFATVTRPSSNNPVPALVFPLALIP